MKRNASRLTSNAMPGRSEREWRVHGQGIGHITPNDGRFVYRDGKFGYRSDKGHVQTTFPTYGAPSTDHTALSQHHAGINNCLTYMNAEPFGSSVMETLHKGITQLGYNQCEDAHPSAQIKLRSFAFRPVCIPFRPPSFIVPEQEEPDLTIADKEWIDKIDGHTLRVEDLY